MSIIAGKNWIIGAGLFFNALFSAYIVSAQQQPEGREEEHGPPAVAAKDGDNKADALFYDAVKAKMKGDEKQSEDLLLQYVKLKPNSAAAYYDLSRLSFKANKADRANEYIKKAIALDGDNKWYQEQYGYILASKNQFAEAGDVFTHLAKTEKHNEDYLLHASRLYQRAGKYKDALSTLDKLIAKTGDGDDDLLIQKQQIYLSMNDLESAAKIIQQLIDKNPKEPKYYGLLAELYENNKETAKAAAEYAKIEQLFPDDPGTQLSLAQHYRKLNNEAKYNEYVKKAITNKDLDVETQLNLSVPYLHELGLDSNKRGESIALAKQLLALHPDNAVVIAFYGDVLSLSSKREEAVVQYKRSLAIDPSKFEVWHNLLINYTDQGSADSLLKYTAKAIKLFPNQAEVHYLNGVGYYNSKNYTSAIRAINRAVDLQSDENAEFLAQMYETLGDIYNTQKDYTNSDSSFERAIRLNPRNASTLNNYGYYLSVRNVRLDEAEQMSRQSLQIRPNEATFLDTYGWILYQQAKYDKAKEYIQKALDLTRDPDPTLYEHMGDVHYKLNDIDKAVDFWRKAKDRGSDNPQIDKKIVERKLL